MCSSRLLYITIMLLVYNSDYSLGLYTTSEESILPLIARILIEYNSNLLHVLSVECITLCNVACVVHIYQQLNISVQVFCYIRRFIRIFINVIQDCFEEHHKPYIAT